ncbi:MAG: DUF4178 domain-containing protein [Bryobacteraceae bacterium]
MSVGSPSVVPQVRALFCPNCGGGVQLRGYAHAVNAVCEHCNSILDASTPSLRVIQQFEARTTRKPIIPLGTHGKLSGASWRVIGFQVRAIEVDGVTYEWSEYLLFNPYKGYRYLTEYDGHWNTIRSVRALPAQTRRGRKKAVRLHDVTYTHFQTAQARTVFVLGEFPWQVRAGETVHVEDYISPPFMLSAEITPEETAWSLGEYTRGKEIWKAFSLSGRPPHAKGIYSNQPSPYSDRVAGIWKTLGVLVLLLAGLAVVMALLSRNQEVLRRQYVFNAASRAEASFVTDIFSLEGRPSNVQVEVRTNLNNSWAFFAFALINEQTGQAWDFGREVSYYQGRDSDGDWTEGSRNSRATIPGIPAGRYYLRVEPEMDESPSAPRRINYELIVRRDVPSLMFFWIVGALLFIPPLFTTFRAFQFENERWRESDYGALVSSSGDDE